MSEDADLRQDFIEYLNVDSALGDLAALSVAEIAELDAAEPSGLVPKTIVGPVWQHGRVIAFVGSIAASPFRLAK